MLGRKKFMNLSNMKRFIFILVISITWIYATPKVFSEAKMHEQSLQLIAKVAKSEFLLNEPIDIILRIKNNKSEPITLIRPNINKILHGWSLVGHIYRRGNLLGGRKRIIRPKILFSMERFLKKEDFVQLKPDEEITVDVRFDSPVHREHYTGLWKAEPSAIGGSIERMGVGARDDILKECFPHAGEYTLMFILENTIDEYIEFIDDKGHVKIVKVDAWTGKVSSNELKIKIKKGREN